MSIGGFLSFTVCRTGLRVGINRLVAPLSRPFFIPWNQIELRRSGSYLRRATFVFGHPAVGKLVVTSNAADRIVAASAPYWDAPKIVTEAVKRSTVRKLFAMWGMRTAIVATVFSLSDRLSGDRGSAASLAGTVLFPALVFGGSAIAQYVSEKRHIERTPRASARVGSEG